MNEKFESCYDIHINGVIKTPNNIIIENGCCVVLDGTDEEDSSLDKYPENSNDFLKKENYLSEFSTEEEKSKVRENLGIKDSEGEISQKLEWGNISGDLDNLKDLYNSLLEVKNPELHPYISSDRPDITNVKEALDVLLYTPLKINYFNITPYEAEIGLTITNVIYKWEYNKSNIISLKLGEDVLDISARSKSISGSFTQNMSKILTASDGTNIVTSSVSLSFKKGRYYGTSTLDPTTETIVNSFTRNLNLNKGNTFSVNAELGEYIYLLVPLELKDIEFVVGGFSGGFSIIDDNFLFSRYPNTTISCVLFKSDNPSLGNTTITIK